MTENEETKWRSGVETGEEERAAVQLAEDEEHKEELQKKIQTKAEDLGGSGEASFITKPEEVPIITESAMEEEKTKKPKAKVARKKKESDNAYLTGISKQLEKQANQLAKIEKAIQPLQKSINKLDKQSNTIKQLYTIVAQLQREIRRRHTQQQPIQKKKKKTSRAN